MNKTKCILVMLALAGSFSANAQKTVCNDLQELAYKIMELRQTGIPASQVIGAADGNKVVLSVIISAYDEPQYRTIEYQARASREFANKVFIDCYKAISVK
jgi:hypothetical protein